MEHCKRNMFCLLIRLMPHVLMLFPVAFFSQQSFNTPDIAPQAPSVASQMKYIETPVSTYNGTSSFSIPLYELNERDITLPISLSYYSNGLKTDEEASWVGLGWNLNAGGFIQFVQQQQTFSVPLAPYNTNLNPTYNSDMQPNKLQMGCTFQTPEGNPISFDNASDVKYYGYEYPLYMYNFNGYSGKFIMTPGGQIINMDKGNIIFTLLPNGVEDGFKAVTPDGMQYYFEVSGRGRSQKPNYRTPCSGPIAINGYSTSYTFNLTKIISPTNSEVTFTYEAIYTKSLPMLSQWYTYDLYDINSGRFLITYSDHQEKILKEINSANTRIRLVSSSRDDIYQGKKLDRIEIYRQGESSVLKSVNLNTNYFIGQTGFGDFLTQSAVLGDCGITQPHNFVTDNFKKMRLKLTSVDFNDDRHYYFDYSTMPLPYKTSLAKDMWGYFNGVPNTTLLPNVNNLGYFDQEVTPYFQTHPFAANRKAVGAYAQGGMLTKITQPTGGYTKMAYESNVFVNMPGTLPLVDVQQLVTNIGAGKDTKTFTIPAINGNSITHLTVNLNCLGPQYGCASGTCLGYPFQSAGVIGSSDNRLYILIEKQNFDGSWSDYTYYDRLSPEMGANCTFDGYVTMPGGTYRMTANFPDNMTTGLMGGPWANAKLIYKDYDTTPNSDNFGAGLRISSLIDYTSETNKFNERFFSYGAGKMITKPDFMYVYDSNIQGSEITNMTATCISSYYGPDFNNCNGLSQNTRHFETLYSESIRPYSYNAVGALVGYNDVTINYGQNSQNGKEVHEYINEYDNIFYYPGMLSGVTGMRKLDNGKIVKKSIYKNSTPLSTTPMFNIVNYEKFDYEVADYKKFWNYIPENHPITFLCSGQWVSSSIADMSRTFMHFYPITVGNVRIKRKTVVDYLASSSNEITEVSNISDYTYNSKHQLISERSNNSLDELDEKRYYYPQELYTEPMMSNLIEKNRINSPIKTEKYRNGVKTSEEKSVYAEDSSTGNLLLPKNVYAAKFPNSLPLIPNIGHLEKMITYDKYDNNGTILQYTPEGGISVVIIWGYNKTLPIAKIENATYNDVSSYMANLQTASNSGTLTQTSFSNLRNALPNAMITTYTYVPLIGISTIADPKGYKTTYIYDSFGRLKEVRDMDNNLLSENQYNYKP
jgi:YD repeat-containing protein